MDLKKVEAIIDRCETTTTTTTAAAADGGVDTAHNKRKSSSSSTALALSVNGFRRLLQSRWGNLLREHHESVFQDMDRPLASYFIFASHNTYLTGLQVHGNATIEGYVFALRKGARLLELDVFDGDNGGMPDRRQLLTMGLWGHKECAWAER